ncbi:MAG: 50S ribosomal protein L17 [Candidatus Sericytochromatia bacterium]|nr:MAG: 50S ribosomal protein L17 [Candidatus Sericytochromatia bacterium]
MRHRKKVDLLSKPADQRKALLKSLATELIKNGKILTTEARAKAVSKLVQKLITFGKKGDLHSRRIASNYLYSKRRGKVLIVDEKEKIDTEKYSEIKKKDRKVLIYEKTPLQKLFNDIAPRYKERNGGYVRVVKAPPRKGDAAPMAVVMLV